MPLTKLEKRTLDTLMRLWWQSRHNCHQCGAALAEGKEFFCDSRCLSAYNLTTWGEGRPEDPEEVSLAPVLRRSLRKVRTEMQRRNWPKK